MIKPLHLVPKNRVFHFYESKKIIGECLYKAITEKLNESNKFPSDKNLKDFHDNFKFLTLLPERTFSGASNKI